MTVLLVDGNGADAAILASALRVEGYEVVVAATAAEARAVLESRPCALAIVDLALRTETGGHGLELARELRRDHPCTRVFLTSSYHLGERQLARAGSGVSGFIPKPYDVREVVDFVHTKLSGPPSSRQLWRVEEVSGVTVRPSLAPLEADGTTRRR